MANQLLIHSMSEFDDIIQTILDLSESKNIVEIGVEYGTHTKNLLEKAALNQGKLYCIDPNPKAEFLECFQENKHAHFLKGKSLDVMNTIDDADAWLIDGDHNWYTVFNELQNIKLLSKKNKKPLLIFLHDVAWPFSRRDLYYDPKSIPELYRNDYDLRKGVHIDHDHLIEGGFRGEGSFFWAKQCGGKKNGVLTAVEDFLKENLDLYFAMIPAIFGLGIIFSGDIPNFDKIVQILSFYHENELISKLEKNRIRNYLAVIGLQDMIQEKSLS